MCTLPVLSYSSSQRLIGLLTLCLVGFEFYAFAHLASSIFPHFCSCLYLCSDNLLGDYPLAGLKRQMRVLHQ